MGYLELIVEDEDGNDIGENLIKKGWAIAKTQHFFPSKDEMMLVD